MPDMIRHPVSFWIPAPFLRRGRHAGMTTIMYLIAGVIEYPQHETQNTINQFFKKRRLSWL
jgi:hypothetical protein